ncbi:L,D-transpeptidase family protein [Paucibacter sp. B2R-40]|uniref:L,D-transpeptidase family protein n=1 Tax=Paucibacter sp. B2R-40 TaxID=2893554 RepID=UPI0021E4AAB3|nr:L,D-transpeptidase family protein [Paucibacter sp. B2R-40]MCV2354432.1 L,D-transpeptidase family protein [Paucibacter sp. B2R-40]
MNDAQQVPDPNAKVKRPGQVRAAAALAMGGTVKPVLLASLGLVAVLGAVGYVFAKVDFKAGSPALNFPLPTSDSSPTQAMSKSSPAQRLLQTDIDGQTPEGQLILAYQHLARGDEAQAFSTAEQLVKRQPDFALAQLLHGDLLLARSGLAGAAALGPEATASAANGAAAAAAAGSIEGLRAEAKLRLAALVERPPQNALPRQLLNLSPAVRHAVVVDTSHARLYLFENGSDGLKLLRDSYVSIGKLGTGKLQEGDQRTPLGIYHVGVRRDEAAARYGAAALPLNYPSEYDRLLGRGGSSIWLHGERAGNYARGPQSTDGCIVLSNDEMRALADVVAARETPVVIVENIDWVDRKLAVKSPLDTGFERAYQAWQQARLSQDATSLRGFYETGLERGSDSAAARLDANLAHMAKQELPVQSLERLSLLPWPDQPSVKIVTYRELSPNGGAPKLKRQYWREKDGHWTIFFDGLVS